MKTSAAPTARPSTAPVARLRRLAVVGLVAPVVALAACSGEAAVTADPTAPAGTSAAVPSPSSTASTATAAPTTTAAPTSTDGPAKDRAQYTTIKATIQDPDLGHTITATRLVRHLRWPSGQPVGAEQFEIVGVRVRVQAGSRYSANVTPSMFSLVASTPRQTITPTSEFSQRWGAAPLKPAQRSQTTSGWVFFKVDRGTTSSLRLVFNRPPYQVSTTGKNFPAKAFSVVLAK